MDRLNAANALGAAPACQEFAEHCCRSNAASFLAQCSAIPRQGPTSAAAAEEGPRQCRICLQSGSARAEALSASELVAPCLCDGTQRWVHRACLDTWRAVKQARRHAADRNTRSVCKYKTNGDFIVGWLSGRRPARSRRARSATSSTCCACPRRACSAATRARAGGCAARSPSFLPRIIRSVLLPQLVCDRSPHTPRSSLFPFLPATDAIDRAPPGSGRSWRATPSASSA